jgi:hypothetical protein
MVKKNREEEVAVQDLEREQVPQRPVEWPAIELEETPQGAVHRSSQTGIIAGILGLLAALNRLLSGPAMTDRDRVRREAAQAEAEREFGLLPH